MFAYIKGKLISTSNGAAIIEANGIGYEVLIPQNILERLPSFDQECQLFTSFVIRENSQQLFGFMDQACKHIFEVLLNISGVGPKMALAMIGNLTLEALQEAICQEDVGVLKKVPGVGKKTAERLIVELKDKLPSLFPRELLVSSGREEPKTQVFLDAVSALVNLGYQQYQAKKAVQQVIDENGEDVKLPDLITLALTKA